MAERTGILSERVRLVVLAAMTVAIVVLLNLQIAGKERILRDGTIVLLRLAPVDPRSLLQGDYMALRYAMTSEVASAARAAGISDGTIVISLAENNEAKFVALYDGQPLSGDQRLMPVSTAAPCSSTRSSPKRASRQTSPLPSSKNQASLAMRTASPRSRKRSSR